MDEPAHINQFNQVIYRQEFDPADLDYALFDKSMVFLDRLSEVENTSVNVFDLYKRKYVYMRSKFSEQLGHNIPKAKDEGPSYFLDLIHPDDIPAIAGITQKVFGFLQSLPVSERKDYKVVYNCRIMGSLGRYLHFLQQNVVLELDRKGNIWLLMTISDLLPETSQFTRFEPRLFNLKSGKQYLFADEKPKKSKVILTLRELEILNLSSKGMASKEIADQLYVSVSTINNHRKNIMGKTRTTNTAEAITYARSLGLL